MKFRLYSRFSSFSFICIQARGVKIAGAIEKDDESEENPDRFLLNSLETCHPSGAKVHVDEASGLLQWPVMFLYPEHTQMDLIEKYAENAW